jgi:hypothetical protein
MIWERSENLCGPWVPVQKVPATILRKVNRKYYDCSGELVPRYKPGDPIGACRYYYRYVTAEPASES